jgi:hypothetical protein
LEGFWTNNPSHQRIESSSCVTKSAWIIGNGFY